MPRPVLYRKRLIPAECVLLDKDEILLCKKDLIVTRWSTIRPKKDLSHGVSAYFPNRGVKVSKFYDHHNRLLCWYCDIISTEHETDTDTYVMTDLLADVLVSPDGSVKVVDLDELAMAAEKKLLSKEQLLFALRCLNNLLNIIYRGEFSSLQEPILRAETSAVLKSSRMP